MGIDVILMTTLTVAGSIGGFWQGKRSSKSTEMGIAVATVSLLETQVQVLTDQGEEKDARMAILESKVEILESLVTQRADVQTVALEVEGVRGVVDRIAAKVEA